MAALVEPRAKVVIGEMSFNDYEEIAFLESRNGLDVKPFAEWCGLWRDNPVFQRTPKWPIGWVARDDKGRIVASLGNIPVSYRFRGRRVIAACGRGLVAQPLYRGYAASLLRRLLNQNLAELVIIASANGNSSRLFEPMRCSRTPAGDWNRSSFWIAQHRDFMRSVAQTKSWPGLVALPMAAASSLAELGRRPFSRDAAHGVANCTEFGDRFDAFWNSLTKEQPNRLIADRSSEILHWHFQHALRDGRAWVATTENAGKLQSYAIFFRCDNPQFGLTRMRMVDFQALDGDYSSAPKLLAWAFDRCRKENIHMLEAFGFRSDKQRMIESARPYHRALPAWAYFYKTNSDELALELVDEAAWDPSHFDGDASL